MIDARRGRHDADEHDASRAPHLEHDVVAKNQALKRDFDVRRTQLQIMGQEMRIVKLMKNVTKLRTERKQQQQLGRLWQQHGIEPYQLESLAVFQLESPSVAQWNSPRRSESGSSQNTPS